MATTTLINKLSKAMADVKGIDKDGENKFQHYDYQTEAAIKHAVKSAIQAQGIVIIPSYEIISQVDKTAQKGNINHFADVMGTFTITDGNESIIGTMPGSGQDTGEKAIAKACTSSQKYFYKQLFNISDKDEDPDGDDSGSYVPNNKSVAKPKPPASKQSTSKADNLQASKNAIENAIKKIDGIAASTGREFTAIRDYFFGQAGLNPKDTDKLTSIQLAQLETVIKRFIDEHKKG